VAYDEALANEVRAALAGVDAVTEKAMFGGLAFLVHGNMAVGISGEELMVRVGPADADAALAEPHTRPFDMTGRPMARLDPRRRRRPPPREPAPGVGATRRRAGRVASAQGLNAPPGRQRAATSRALREPSVWAPVPERA
jgi:hypothetical protein